MSELSLFGEFLQQFRDKAPVPSLVVRHMPFIGDIRRFLDRKEEELSGILRLKKDQNKFTYKQVMEVEGLTNQKLAKKFETSEQNVHQLINGVTKGQWGAAKLIKQYLDRLVIKYSVSE